LQRLAHAQEVLVSDGGLSTELEARGHDISDYLWSARILKDDPAAILDVHRAFFAAGADIATTATYQATFPGFARAGLDQEQAAHTMELGVRLAQQAAGEVTDRPTYVAASIGPYGAMLADGSEYRGDYGVSKQELRDFHRPRLEVMAGFGADILAVETIPCALEVEALCEELDDLGVPSWVSLSVGDGCTRAKEPLHDIYSMLSDVPSVVAVGVNCSTAADVATAITIASEATNKPIVAYPNSGEGWNATARSWQGAEAWETQTATSDWRGRGATVVGGCCRVHPQEIHELAQWAAEAERRSP
jgi:homocysteine S-methyltransferase